MSQEAKLTHAVRLRSQKAGDWLVAPVASTTTTKRRKFKTGSFATQTTMGPTLMPDFQEFLSAAHFETSVEQVLLIAAEDSATLERMQRFFSLLEDRLEGFEEAEMLRLIDVAMPMLLDRPPPEAIEQARRNAQARKDFLRQFEVLEAEEVHALYGSRAKNKAALAARWRAEGQIIAVEHEGRLFYPAFQFDAQGRPRSVIADVLAALGDQVGPWQVALWLVSPNGWLDGATPLDLLDEDPNRVIDAAGDIAVPASY